MDASRISMVGSPTIVPVIMAGGSGTRLWPLSREQYPKQFLPLTGERSLLQNTVLRAAQISNAVQPVVIGTEAHRFLIADQLREIGASGATILLEPEGRNTAPAAAVAAHFVAAEYGPEAVLFLMSADHAMHDAPRFLAAVEAAAPLAAQRLMVVFGIRPTRPDTGFGYIRMGAPLTAAESGSASTPALRVDAFVEKPTAETAQAFLSLGNYYWNAGLFMFRADRFLEELERLEPDLARHSREALKGSRSNGFIHLDPHAFGACRRDSIDYAVMEKASGLAAVPLDAGWDDVGSWTYLGTMPATDASGNHVRGDVMLHDSENNLVHSGSRLVALLGVKDMVVVETGDAVLVAPRERAQDVKQIVQQLKRDKRPEAEAHPRVYRPWGYYETVADGERFQVKRICVKPGEKLSLQMHHHRAEHWIVVKGTARVTCGQRVYLLSENQSTYIPLGYNHRLENPGKVPLELIEVQSGSYLGEDDIVRFDDVYGRAGEVTSPPAPPSGVVATDTGSGTHVVEGCTPPTAKR